MSEVSIQELDKLLRARALRKLEQEVKNKLTRALEEFFCSGGNDEAVTIPITETSSTLLDFNKNKILNNGELKLAYVQIGPYELKRMLTDIAIERWRRRRENAEVKEHLEIVASFKQRLNDLEEGLTTDEEII